MGQALFIMAKRFTDTDKWKKGFIKRLPPEYKLLWFYILDDCSRSGIWDVDMDIARLRTGCLTLDNEKAVELFGDMIHPFDNGEKWFIKKFPIFQYGHLKPDHYFHKTIISELTEKNLYTMSQDHLYDISF